MLGTDPERLQDQVVVQMLVPHRQAYGYQQVHDAQCGILRKPTQPPTEDTRKREISRDGKAVVELILGRSLQQVGIVWPISKALSYVPISNGFFETSVIMAAMDRWISSRVEVSPFRTQNCSRLPPALSIIRKSPVSDVQATLIISASPCFTSSSPSVLSSDGIHRDGVRWVKAAEVNLLCPRLTPPFSPIPASIWPINVVGIRRWETPRRSIDAANVTMSEQTPPPIEIRTPRRSILASDAARQTVNTESNSFRPLCTI